MKKNLRIHSRHLLFSITLGGALAVGSPMSHAAVIEHQGDRYIIHVAEMELNGEESLLDVLQLCPDLMTLDGNNLLSGDPFSNLYGKYAIRIDNQEYGLDYTTLLHHLKAREIESIKVCHNAEVMKGCTSLKRIIDITLRKGENKTSGRIGLMGDTYGGGKLIVSALHQQDKFRILSHVEGCMQRSNSIDESGYEAQRINNHYSHEGAKFNFVWTPTSKDNLEIDAFQTYTRNHFTGNLGEYARNYHIQADYTRTLGENGSSVLFTLSTDHIGDNGGGTNNGNAMEAATEKYHNRYDYPWGVVEFAFPLVTKDLWLTAGIEAGLSIEKNCIAQYTNHSNYQDFYGQIDWNVGKWAFMVGDRYRIINFNIKQIDSQDKHKHTTHDNAYTVSAAYSFTQGNTLQGSFAHRFYNADFGDFITTGDQESAWTPVYTNDLNRRMAYVSELKHTYSRPNLVISSQIQNIHQDIPNGHDNRLGIGSSLFWHTGILRLTAGFNYYWEKQSIQEHYNQSQDIGSQPSGTYWDHRYSNYAVFKLAPQLSLADGWRLTSNLIWSTRRHEYTLTYAPANLYAEVGVYKSMGKHWSIEGRFHDIAGQHMGNRAATIGATYYW